MSISIAQQVQLAAVSLEDHGTALRSKDIKAAAKRLAAGGDSAHTEEGQSLMRSASDTLYPLGGQYEDLAVFIRRTADYLELEKDDLARNFATQVIAQVKVIRTDREVEK